MFRIFRTFRRKRIQIPTRGLGWIPNSRDKRDWDFDRMGLASASLDAAGLEAYIREILSQGSTSSCVAQALAGAIHLLEVITQLPYEVVARLFLYYFARLQHQYPVTDSGTSIRLAVKALFELGVPSEEFWPFSTQPATVNQQPRGWEPYMRAHPRRGGEYYAIKDSGTARVDAIKAAISSKYPVVFGTPVAKTMLPSNGSSVIDRPGRLTSIAGGHAMVIVGYRDGGDLFRVLNSWGNDWRDGGLCWMTRDYITWSKTTDLTIIRGWERLQRRAA